MCNLKSNKTLVDFKTYLNEINNISSKEQLVIFPPFLYLPLINNKIKFGAQDVSVYTDGSSTGEITAEQIKSCGASYVIIGHSERRSKFEEDEHLLLKKINNALNNNLQIVYCIGETQEEKLRQKTYQVLEKQIAKIFNSLSEKDIKNIIIAYEPIWAIGTGTSASEKDIEEITTFIKKIVLDYYDINIKVLYGGSVNKLNTTELSKIDSVDGFLVGKASLNPEEIIEMLNICAN